MAVYEPAPSERPWVEIFSLSFQDAPFPHFLLMPRPGGFVHRPTCRLDQGSGCPLIRGEELVAPTPCDV